MLRKLPVGSFYGLAVLLLAGVVASCGGGAGGGNNSGGATYTLSGTVSGVVQQGITITLSGAGTGTTTTSAGGTYSFAGLANGYYTVTASLVTYAFTPSAQVVPVNYANAAAADFVSENAYSIAGSILDGTGIQGVTVSLSGANLSTAVSVVTDVNGDYIFSGIVTNGTYTVTPSKSQQSCVCRSSITGGCTRTITESYIFVPSSLSIAINGADATPSVDFTGSVPRYQGLCPAI